MRNQIDRALEILLLLRGRQTISAKALAARFEVSTRTIYRDIETLSAAGVPVYAEMGRDGGFRLLEGYFLPPVMFTEEEAASLLIGSTLLRRLRVAPFAAAVETAERKLLATLPERLAALLTKAPQLIGFEHIPLDLFQLKLQPDQPNVAPIAESAAGDESVVVSTFLRAVFERQLVELDYHSPYGERAKKYIVQPYGLIWDRDWWYLVGQRINGGSDHAESAAAADDPWLWRADRVLRIALRSPSNGSPAPSAAPDFDVGNLLGRTWLAAAMQKWRTEAPVQLRMTAPQARLLQQDWYYRYADYAARADGDWLVTFGEDNPQIVFDLLRWLGPGAELIAPQAWRTPLRDELLSMAALYAEAATASQ
ncbi:MAG: YafY family protein [Caldilineaceae bacterium]